MSRRGMLWPNDVEKGGLSLQSRPVSSRIDSGKTVGENSSFFEKENSKAELRQEPEVTEENEDHEEQQSETTEEVHLVNKKWVPSKIWFLLVLLGSGACWVPAILEWLKFPNARVWGVRLLFWSIWLSILWAGWWIALVFSWIVHTIILSFINWFDGYVYRPYMNALDCLHQYFALVAWSLAVWITWVPVIVERQLNDGSEQSANSRSARALNLGGRLFFAMALAAGLLFVEKIAVQWIAMSFHKRAYRNSINDQKEAVTAFKELYAIAQKRIPNRMQGHKHRRSGNTTAVSQGDTLPRGLLFDAPHHLNHNHDDNGVNLLRSSMKTAFADAWTQIFGEAISDDVIRAFHTKRPELMKELAIQIWYGLATPTQGLSGSGSTSMNKEESAVELCKSDIKDFVNSHTSEEVNSIKTKKTSSNGEKKGSDGGQRMEYEAIWNVLTGGRKHRKSITRAQFEKRCSDLHAEQLRLERTMNDLNNVVGKLDNLMVLFWLIASILIIAVALEAELKTLIFGAGAAFVGMSWLLRDTASEILGSLVFLFNKHPYDVGDKVVINLKRYTVKEMRLLSTVFSGDDSVLVQAPNKLLNTLFIHNLRRSPATSERFTFEISDETTQDQLNSLTDTMESFLQRKENEKDYRPDFRIEIQELSCQGRKLIITSDIQYNNNWESNDKVRAERRNKWIMNLRDALRKAEIKGPGMPSMRIIQAQ